jgi:hypothetical protein
MPDPANPPPSPGSAPDSRPGGTATRRRFLQGGLAAAPVLMTLTSRPVLAGPVQTPSAFCSGNESTPGRGLTSTGKSPKYWSNPQNFGAWRPPYRPGRSARGNAYGNTERSEAVEDANNPPTLFDSVFKPHYRGLTLVDVMEHSGGTTDEVARQCVAVVLNIAAGWTPVITVNTVKGIWSEYLTKGYFEPTAGIHWDGGQILEYFRSMT